MRTSSPFLEPQLPQPGRARGFVLAAGGAGSAVLGAVPHLLHHAGPLAGAALVSGALGTVVFGALGLLVAVPMLLRVRRRTGSWRLPGVLLGLFTALFLVSSLLVGPALNDESDEPQATPAKHESHHP